MRSLERHRDAGAYALGVLDATERSRFEDHLLRCPVCAERLSELGPAAGVLGVYARVTPRRVELFARPAPTLVERAVDRLAALHRAARRRQWGTAVAAVLLLGAAGQGATLLAADGSAGGDGGGHPAALTLRGRDPATGVVATLSADGREWGTQVGLDVRVPGGPRVCELVAVGRDGGEQTVASWAVRSDRTEVQGGAADRPEEIRRFEVRATGGERLLALPVSGRDDRR
ncbi:zf-HC2 domain-containing protein [Streptomyces sp. NPDC102467]|uniref:zf-HC2 domain-containing protein n=1 Tax=Streptomyces sp. NPDC102467 TaxID=3366179 RepID=UPI0038028722